MRLLNDEDETKKNRRPPCDRNGCMELSARTQEPALTRGGQEEEPRAWGREQPMPWWGGGPGRAPANEPDSVSRDRLGLYHTKFNLLFSLALSI